MKHIHVPDTNMPYRQTWKEEACKRPITISKLRGGVNQWYDLGYNKQKHSFV